MGLSSRAQDFNSVVQRARNERWAEDIQWLRLLQYQSDFYIITKSQAGSDKFFLDPKGSNHPDLELYATIRDLSANTRTIKSRDGKFTDVVSCIFPARKMWLEKKSGVKFPTPPCDRYDRFKEILQAKSLTYVFSSYYLNNPSSAFGHTFLRINKGPSARDGERYDLEDYGIGYAALPVSSNPIVYSVLGISGLTPGVFDINPYYFKVREYNDFESRDLWEYDLGFNPEEVDLIVAFFWEVSDVNFNYHYFSQNCSYRILAALEVARPSLHLIDDLKLHVMPGDTVQTLYRVPGLVTKIHYRPSARMTFRNRFEQLPDDLKERIQKFAVDESPSNLIQNLSSSQKVGVLDTAMDEIDFLYPKDIAGKTGKYSLKKEVLIDRAEVGVTSLPLEMKIPWSEAPHDAHGSRRLGAGIRHWQNDDTATLVSMKFALHDLLDEKWGYPPTAQITMGDFALSFRPHQSSIEKAIFFEVISLAPLDDFMKSPSWRLKISNERGYENNCIGLCHWTELSGGIGLTKTLVRSLDVSLWLRANSEYNVDFSNEALRIGAGPAAMLRWNHGIFSLLGESYYRYDYKGAAKEFRQNSIGAQLTPQKSWALRASAQDSNSQTIFDTQLFYYY